MTIFARSDVHGITVNHNGHEHVHERALVGRHKVPAQEFSVDCEHCERFLLEMFPDQWSSNPKKLPLTPDEEIERERHKVEGDALTQQMARSMAEVAAAAIGGVSV